MAVVREAGRSGRSRLAISALVIGVVIFVAVGIAAEVLLLPKASSSSSSVASTSGVSTSSGPAGTVTPSSPVQSAVDAWLADFNSRNVNGIASYYATDATVLWTGNAAGLAGTYSGVDNIKILYGSSIGKTIVLNASIGNYVATPINQDNQNVSLTLTMNGNSSVVGTMSSTVAVVQDWWYQGGSWQIQKETWNYITFTVEFPVSATTFPQWAALKTGQNPNLVSEKSFEWHAGPYVAASVYAVMFGVLAVGFLKFRQRRTSGYG